MRTRFTDTAQHVDACFVIRAISNACAFQPLQSGSNRAWVPNNINGDSRSIHRVLCNGKKDARIVFFFLQNLALQLGLGQRRQPER